MNTLGVDIIHSRLVIVEKSSNYKVNPAWKATKEARIANFRHSVSYNIVNLAFYILQYGQPHFDGGVLDRYDNNAIDIFFSTENRIGFVWKGVLG